MPAASAYAASFAQPDRKARTIGVIILGNTIATLIGAPLGTIIGNEFGWRMTFLGVAAATMVAFAGIVMSLPRLSGNEAATLADRLSVARRPDVIAVLTVTLLGTIGSFSVYTYLAPFLQATVGFSGHAIAGVLLLFGLSGLIGNIGGGIALDRWGPRPVLPVVLTILAAALATLSLAAAALESRVAAIVCCLAIAVWAAFGWSFPIGQQIFRRINRRRARRYRCRARRDL